MAHSAGSLSAYSSLFSKLVGRGKIADLCPQLLRLEIQFRISIRHCHTSTQLAQTFGKVRGYKLIVHDQHDGWKSRCAYYRDLLIRF